MPSVGVFPVHNNIFKIGSKGRASAGVDFVIIKDLETFEPTIDGKVIDWTPMDQAGWIRRAVTGKGLGFKFKGKRNYGDTGNDYVAGMLLGTGQTVETIMQWTMPDGSVLTMPCVIDLKTPAGGDSTSIDTLEFDLLSDGLPTFVPVSRALTFVTVDGATAGKTKIATAGVAPALTGGNSYKYALNTVPPAIGASAAAYGTAYTLNTEVAATEGDTFYLVEIDASNLVVKIGFAHANVQ